MKWLIDRCTESNEFAWDLYHAGVAVMLIIAIGRYV